VLLSTELPSDANLSTLATSEFLHASGPPDTAVSNRAPVRQLEEAVQAQEAQLIVAHSERLPTLSVVSGYQRLYFPNTLLPNLNQGRNNWTIGLSSTFSLFTGGRFRGDELVAQANIDQYKEQLRQTRALAQLDTRVALSQLDQADAAWRASQGTVEQAQRAYSIDEIRYREGISTQTDLAQSRLLIEQATANRAQAARDLAVARMRLQLLHDLPLQSSAGASSGSTQRAPQQQQPTPSSSSQQTGGPPGSFVP
jgi:outer membrane protein TolC